MRCMIVSEIATEWTTEVTEAKEAHTEISGITINDTNKKTNRNKNHDNADDNELTSCCS